MLRANGHKAVVVIATDGESSDGDIADAMKPLEVTISFSTSSSTTSSDLFILSYRDYLFGL